MSFETQLIALSENQLSSFGDTWDCLSKDQLEKLIDALSQVSQKPNCCLKKLNLAFSLGTSDEIDENLAHKLNEALKRLPKPIKHLSLKFKGEGFLALSTLMPIILKDLSVTSLNFNVDTFRQLSDADENTDEDFKQITTAIKNLKLLEKLDLSYNQIGKRFLSALYPLPAGLRELNLHHNLLKSWECSELLGYLQGRTQLTKLILTSNCLEYGLDTINLKPLLATNPMLSCRWDKSSWNNLDEIEKYLDENQKFKNTKDKTERAVLLWQMITAREKKSFKIDLHSQPWKEAVDNYKYVGELKPYLNRVLALASPDKLRELIKGMATTIDQQEQQLNHVAQAPNQTVRYGEYRPAPTFSL